MSVIEDNGRRRLGRGLAALIGDASSEFEVVVINDEVQRTCDELVSLLVGRPDESRNQISGVAE